MERQKKEEEELKQKEDLAKKEEVQQKEENVIIENVNKNEPEIIKENPEKNEAEIGQDKVVLRGQKKSGDKKITNIPDVIDIEKADNNVDAIREENGQNVVQERAQRGKCGCFIF